MQNPRLFPSILAAWLTAGALLNPASGHAQVNPQLGDLASAVEEARTALSTD